MPRKGILTLFLFEEGGEIKEKTEFSNLKGSSRFDIAAAPWLSPLSPHHQRYLTSPLKTVSLMSNCCSHETLPLFSL